MTKLFVYNVNGTTFEDTEAFGKAWKEAKDLATKEKTIITRQVICGNEIRNEFFAKAGIFLNEKSFEFEKVKIF